ncbi:unnamed protein product, partial [Chrysoparadoxa australica]
MTNKAQRSPPSKTSSPRRSTTPPRRLPIAAGTAWRVTTSEESKERSPLREPYRDLKTYVHKLVEDKNVDIYIMAAIICDPALNTATELPLFRSGESVALHHLFLTSAQSRAVMSVWLQLGVITLVLAQTVLASEKGWCNMTPWSESYITKICAGSFCAFLWCNFVRLLSRDHENNRLIQAYLGGVVADFPKYPCWLTVGIWANALSIIVMSWTSLAVIYTSSNALDIILKTMALRFINDLDDNLVTTYDREAALRELEGHLPTSTHRRHKAFWWLDRLVGLPVLLITMLA